MGLPQPIAHGRTAEIYPWREGMVLKLFHPWVSAGLVTREACTARAVNAAGCGAPRVGDVVEVDGRLGLEYERLEGRPMGQLMADRPWMLSRFARQLADLHVAMHCTLAPVDLPAQRERLVRKILDAAVLPLPLQEAGVRALAQMPDGDRLCHGDFHPLNVLLHRGRAAVIDWVDATRGNPLADVARTVILMQGVINQTAHGTLAKTGFVERAAIRAFVRAYLHRYFARRRTSEIGPGSEAEYRRWRPIVAAARMSEGIPGLDEWLLQQAVYD